MHEASLMTSLMRQIETLAAAEGARQVTSIAVRLGAHSHMSPSHFAEHFKEASASGVAAGARLDITVSDETDDPYAADILLQSVEIEA
ncbi:hydrogenase/urease maturation nickel metallochaperone HypA [Desertibaculum subflavum]|uniref:hydrogenase/urease maturation nickel metallochaperone HypA n=1 Tax=Desertibaculum subflavum TaxID=2268458 RepID=UPI000E66BED9